MKKVISMFIVICTLAMVSVSAFADEGIIGSSISRMLDETGKYWITEETFEDGSTYTYVEPCDEEEETIDELLPSDLVAVCQECGKIHEGLCKESAARVSLDKEQKNLFKTFDMKENAVYFVTADQKLMLLNVATKQFYFIADDVAGLTRFGMNGCYIGYVTLKDEFFSVPYEVGKDGKLSTEFQMEFGE